MDEMPLCVGCGRDITALGPGETKYQGYVFSESKPWHVSCLHEAEAAIERGLEQIWAMGR